MIYLGFIVPDLSKISIPSLKYETKTYLFMMYTQPPDMISQRRLIPHTLHTKRLTHIRIRHPRPLQLLQPTTQPQIFQRPIPDPSLLLLQHLQDPRHFPQRQSAISSKRRRLRPRRANPIPLQEIIECRRRIGAENTVGLEHQEMFGRCEHRVVEMRVCEQLADGFAVLERVV